MKTQQIFLVTLIYVLSGLGVSAQNEWSVENGLRRWRGAEIVSPHLGCYPTGGNPTVELASGVAEIDLISGAQSQKSKPGSGVWTYMPRNPRLMISVSHTEGAIPQTSVLIFDTYEGAELMSFTADVNTTELAVDVADTWVSDDGSTGAVVFAPVGTTPSDKIEYVIITVKDKQPQWIRRVKPKIDVDIYVRPVPEQGVLIYLRGNGMSFPPQTEEVFTNASYIVYSSDGSYSQLNVPERGPGSGRGRKIIWHSNRWDRLLFTDEFAPGALLIKASNGVPVDTVENSLLDPSKPLRILSASGNNTDRWLVTHAKAGDKNGLILWAMPDGKDVATYEFSSSDPAVKQMPLSPWSVIVPFLSVSVSGNILFAWDPQDVVSVHEDQIGASLLSPLPAINAATLLLPKWQCDAEVTITNLQGLCVHRIQTIADGSSVSFGLENLPAGLYLVRVSCLQGSNLEQRMPLVISR